MDNSTPLMVTIRCTVYNHAKYLRQCLDGIVMQKTSFHFIAIVHDDASTDNSAVIIKEYAQKYPSIIVPIYETENVYSKDKGKLRAIMDEACLPGKYMAYCEGDDYWLDPYKLQKQVDIMESNEDLGLIYGKSVQFDDAKQRFLKRQLGERTGSPTDLLLSNTVPTATALVRMSLYKDYLSDKDLTRNQRIMGDYPLWIYCSVASKVEFLDEVMAVYRVLPESASHSNTNRKKLEDFYYSATQMKLFFNKRYRLCEDSEILSQLNELLLFNAVAFSDSAAVIKCYKKINNPSRSVKLFYLLARINLLSLYKIYKRVV